MFYPEPGDPARETKFINRILTDTNALSTEWIQIQRQITALRYIFVIYTPECGTRSGVSRTGGGNVQEKACGKKGRRDNERKTIGPVSEDSTLGFHKIL